MQLKIRVFRASNDPAASYRYYEGHKRRLAEYGLDTVVQSLNPDWMHPDTYLIIVEDERNGIVHGGCRIQFRTPACPLPIEKAFPASDTTFHNFFAQHNLSGLAEFCGLWCSREIARKGIHLIVLRAGLAVAAQLEIGSLIALCSPNTKQAVINLGFEIVSEIGNNGTIGYPTKEMIATTYILTDVAGQPHAHDEEREAVESFRKRPVQTISAGGPMEEFPIHVDLTGSIPKYALVALQRRQKAQIRFR